MKNSTYKINKYPQYTIEYYNDILDITDPELVSFIQDSFINCYEINDVDIKEENYDYKKYIKDIDILLIREDSKYLCFGLVPYVPSFNGMNLSFYMPKSTNPLLFESLAKAGLYFSMYLRQDDDFSNQYLYFDISSYKVYKWCKELIPSLKVSKVRQHYMICHSPISKKYIENIILKDCEITLC